MPTAAAEILILVESPFSKRDYDRFGVDVLRRHFAVSILDCTAWLRPDFWLKYGNCVFACDGYVQIADAGAFAARLEQVVGARTVAVDYLGAGIPVSKARCALNAAGVRRVVVDHGLIPAPAMGPATKLRRLINSGPAAVMRRVKVFFAHRLMKEPPPDVILSSGTAAGTDGGSRRLWAHSFDYDIFLAERGGSDSSRGRYAVFLDEDMAYHSDFDGQGIRTPVTENEYFGGLARAFDEVERRFGLKVVVAAHPRARYDLRPSLWKDRLLEQGNTARLVRDASLVILHQSTAISFAVMWRKPVLLLTSHQLRPSYLQPRIEELARLLDVPLLNVDVDDVDALDERRLFRINEAAYAAYSESFIKRKGTPDLPVWEIFSDYLRRELAV